MGTLYAYRDLIILEKSYSLAMEIFEITKTFPEEERYSLMLKVGSLLFTLSLISLANIVYF
jgi:hypothetical protein